MLTNERHQYILQLLNEKQTVKIQDLVESTAASESTIRRDLTDLEEAGKLARVFGGATLAGRNLLEPSISDKSTQWLTEKINIARYAATWVQQGDSVYLDAGTTTFQLIPFLKEKDVVVVTNGLTLVEALNEQGIPTYLTGGLMKPHTGAFVGAQTIQALQNYRFDICFLGINGCHPEYGYTTPDPEEAAVKQMASSLARKTVVLADHSKLNQISFAKIMDLEQAPLIVDEISKEANAVIGKKTVVKVVSS